MNNSVLSQSAHWSCLKMKDIKNIPRPKVYLFWRGSWPQVCLHGLPLPTCKQTHKLSSQPSSLQNVRDTGVHLSSCHHDHCNAVNQRTNERQIKVFSTDSTNAPRMCTSSLIFEINERQNKGYKSKFSHRLTSQNCHDSLYMGRRMNTIQGAGLNYRTRPQA